MVGPALPAVATHARLAPTPAFGTWAETAQVTPADAHDPGTFGRWHWGVFFGSAVALDGDTLVVGTQLDRHSDAVGADNEEGADWAYVFHRDADGAWVQEDKLLPENERSGDTFAYSVAVDEASGTVVVGNPAAEAIHIFERTPDGSWDHAERFERPGGWGFGRRVSVSGGTVVASHGGGSEPARVSVLEKADGLWTETERLPGGIQVALGSDTLVTSRWDASSSSNRFVVYEREPAGWTETARLDPGGDYNNTNTVPGRVDVSSDGGLVILGSPIDRRLYGIDTEARGLGTAAHGSAWIYERVAGAWRQTADLANPDPGPSHELFGISVGIDGSRAVVGASRDFQNGGFDTGAAYVYDQLGDSWTLSSKLRSHDAGVGSGLTVAQGDRFGSAVDLSADTVVVGAPFDDNRRDGTPYPLDDEGDVPPCVEKGVVWGCDGGEDAGSVYVFEPVSDIDETQNQVANRMDRRGFPR